MKQILFSTLFIVLSFLFSFSTSIAQTQEDTTKIDFVSYWAKGDVYDFKVTKIKKKWSQDQLTTNDSSQYIARFEVLDSTATSYTIKWTYTTDLMEGYAVSEKLAKKLSKYNETEVIYKTDELGAFVEIKNWKELSSRMTEAFEELIKSEKEDNKRKKLEMRLTPLMTAYQSKEGIEQVMFKELQSFHLPLGAQFDVTKPMIYEENIPNLVTGGSIKGEGEIVFTEVDRAVGYCIFTQKLKLNPEDAKAMVIAMFKKMKLPEEEYAKEIEKATMSINDDNRYEYFYYPGLPSDIITIREVVLELKNEKMRQIEKTRIEMIFED
jgi:hypothetical protein